MHLIRRPFSLDFARAGRSIPARIAIIAITTRSSISVKADVRSLIARFVFTGIVECDFDYQKRRGCATCFLGPFQVRFPRVLIASRDSTSRAGSANRESNGILLSLGSLPGCPVRPEIPSMVSRGSGRFRSVARAPEVE